MLVLTPNLKNANNVLVGACISHIPYAHGDPRNTTLVPLNLTELRMRWGKSFQLATKKSQTKS